MLPVFLNTYMSWQPSVSAATSCHVSYRIEAKNHSQSSSYCNRAWVTANFCCLVAALSLNCPFKPNLHQLPQWEYYVCPSPIPNRCKPGVKNLKAKVKLPYPGRTSFLLPKIAQPLQKPPQGLRSFKKGLSTSTLLRTERNWRKTITGHQTTGWGKRKYEPDYWLLTSSWALAPRTF